MTNKKVTLDRGWSILLKDVGIDPENVLRRAALPLDLLTQEHGRVTPLEYFRLWNALEAEAADPTLVIRLGKVASPEIFHPPIFAALCSPNFRTAVNRIAQYKRLIAPMSLNIEEGPAGLSVSKQWDDPTLTPPAILGAMEVVFLTQIARIGTRDQICPVKVETRFEMKPAEAYREFFGIAPEPAEINRVTFSHEDVDRPFLTVSEVMWSIFEPELQRRISKLEASASLNERVRSILLETLPGGETSVHAAARRLGVSARTLQRTLKREGASYKELVRQTREQLARHYVTKTSLAYGEISFLIGFEEPSSFFRAFREWTGETPEAFRAQV